MLYKRLYFVLLQTTVDKELQQSIDDLYVKCSFHGKGCKWTATLRELQVVTRRRLKFVDLFITFIAFS